MRANHLQPESNPIHVLIVDHTSGLGGAEFSLEALVTAMPPERCSYTVALPEPGPLVERLRAQGVTVTLIPLESWRWWVNTPKHILKFFLTLPLQVLSLLRWLRFLYALHPDLVHFNINRVVEPVLAAWLLRIPSVMHFRDIPSRMSQRFILGWGAFYAIMNLAGYSIANSMATEQDIQPRVRRPVRMIPNGLDLEKFDRAAEERESEPVPADSLKVAMVALLVPWKNHPAFLQLAQHICEKRSDVLFLIAGSGQADYTVKLKQLAHNLGVAEKVKFLGHVNNVPALLRHVDLLIHTTDREPFGRVFIEAMAAYRPVVAFDSGGAAEIVVDGETGVLVPPGDLEAMAAAVCRLLDDSELRQRMGEAGRRRVEGRYAIQRHVDAVLQVYEEVLRQRSDRRWVS